MDIEGREALNGGYMVTAHIMERDETIYKAIFWEENGRRFMQVATVGHEIHIEGMIKDANDLWAKYFYVKKDKPVGNIRPARYKPPPVDEDIEFATSVLGAAAVELAYREAIRAGPLTVAKVQEVKEMLVKRALDRQQNMDEQ